MARLTSDLHGGVQAAHKFDEGALLRYVQANVEGFPSNLLKFTVAQVRERQPPLVRSSCLSFPASLPTLVLLLSTRS